MALRRGSGRKTERTGTPADLLVVGLGNPGDEYADTRHNVGADVVAILLRRHGGRLRPIRREPARADEVRVDGKRLALAVPTTYMNESGLAVAALVRRFGVRPQDLVIVHDELDLPVATLRVKAGGGLAGHNGLRSVSRHLKTDDYLRVRIGVGKPAAKERGAGHVLSRFSKRERAEIDVTLEDAADAVEVILTEGVERAMNRFN